MSWIALKKLLRRVPLLQQLWHTIRKDPNHFLFSVSGVIHVGANTGQEREGYEEYGLNVLWVEPIPNIFKTLEKNIEHLHRQRAILALVTEQDNRSYQFHVADNAGASSSILELKDHKDLWPNVRYSETIPMTSTTLPSLLKKENIDLSKFNALIMDTQGSELLVLQGALPILRHFKFIKTEVADFEAYADCCQLEDINRFMEHNGFENFSQTQFAGRSEVGHYFDVTYKRVS